LKDTTFERFRLTHLRASFRHTRATVTLVWQSSPRLTLLLGGLTLLGAGIPLAIAVVAAVALMCWRARRSSATDDLFCWTTAFVLAANLLVIPTIAPYNQLLLLPGIFLLLQTWNKGGRLNRTGRVLGWVAAGCLAWPLITATGLTFFSFFTPAVQRFWEIPLWTSIVIPIPITACLALCIRQMQSGRGEAALTTSP